MSSLTTGMRSERTNRWLLIGAAALAVIAGALVFAALANFGEDDGSTSSGGGSNPVLVARQTINQGTKLEESMFESVNVGDAELVPGAIADDSVFESEAVTNAAILKGEQLSVRRLAGASTGDDETLGVAIERGSRAYAISVSEQSIIGGFLVPGDRVDVIGVFKENRGQSELTRVETILQNVLVLGVAQEPVETTPVLDADGAPLPEDERPSGRVSDADPNPGARTVSLQLTLQQVQVIAAADSDGELSLALRPLGEDDVVPIDETNLDDFGFLPPLPRPQ